MKDIELRENRRFSGKYRDIHFEIQRFKSYDKESFEYSWTFYLYIDLGMIPTELRERFWLEPKYETKFSENLSMFPMYDYDSEPLISDLEWPGGCTYYSKETSVDHKNRIVKIGCDYQHSWDVGKRYDQHIILFDVKNCIDNLYIKVHARNLRMNLRCRYNGGWYSEEEGTVDDGVFTSNEGKRHHTKLWNKVTVVAEGR